MFAKIQCDFLMYIREAGWEQQQQQQQLLFQHDGD